MMKHLIALLLAACALLGPARASEGGIAWDSFPVQKLNDVASLQNGAKLFVNYCLNCHSAAYMGGAAVIGAAPQGRRARRCSSDFSAWTASARSPCCWCTSSTR